MIKLKNVLLLKMVLIIVLTASTVECAKYQRLQQDASPTLKQSENTFLQWVLSLITQRPQQNAASATTTTTPLAITTTAAINTEEPTTKAPVTSTLPSISTSISTSTTATPAAESSTATASTTTASTTTPTIPIHTTKAPIAALLDPPRKCPDCVCGIANTQKRIVGGQETEVHQYPWMAMLLYGGRFYCAASLINDQFLITASHCVNGFRIDRITVRLLEHDRKMSHFSKIDRKLMNITTHPKYSARTFDNDIAVLKLSEPVEFKELLRPACLPIPGRSFKGETATVTGWGATKVGGPTADALQEVHVPILSQEECRRSRYGPKRITDNMLCAGYDEGEKDSCQGDSGGPLHIIAPGTREHQIAGVVSWGEGCAKPGYPGVYARVNRYGTWIKTLARNACWCHSEVKKIKYL